MPAFPRNWTRALLGAVIAGAATLAQALEVKPFSAETLAAAQAAGKPVAVHFHAEWCGTCKQQEKAIAQLRSETGLDVLLLVADYDKEKDLRKALRVRSQSTMVVFRGKDERARLAGDTSAEKFRTALRAAL
jgi:thioredoxin-like negative regulator of GroEL